MQQLLGALAYLHSNNISHRDIKPDNIVIGLGAKANQVHLIDFGLGKVFRDPQTQQHIPFTKGNGFLGTAQYAGINAHLGHELGRRDDLETIGHVLLYFVKGSLPWQGLPGRNKDEKYQNIKNKKLETSLEELCQNVPREFYDFMVYCRRLQFDEEPKYKYCTGLFMACL